MTRRDYALILAVVVAAAAMLAAGWSPGPLTWAELGAGAVLTGFATLSQLYQARSVVDQTYYPHHVFFFAGIVLLTPPLFACLIAVPHVVEMVYLRRKHGKFPFPPIVQVFNVAMHLIVGLTAWWLIRLAPSDAAGPLSLLFPVFAALAYVTLNHLIVGLVLVLINGLSWSASGMLEYEPIMSELALALLGFACAVLWRIDPWLIVPALAPLLLMARALHVPKLQREAQTDSKTGLLNARYLQFAMEEEFTRASRSGRPLALIMADLDFLRTINNSYGHLAGDAVLIEIGKIIRAALRAEDQGGRFGGEEFTIVLPNTDGRQAAVVAERIRATIEATPISVPLRQTPIYATMSFGVAERTAEMTTVTDLTDAADVAVYQAKNRGRNRVEIATSVLLAQAKAELAEAGVRAV